MLDRLARIVVVTALTAASCFQDTGGALTSSGPTTGGTSSTTTTGAPTTTSGTDPSSTSGSTSTGSIGSTTGAGTAATTSTTGPPPDLPPCAFSDDFEDAAVSNGRWLIDGLVDPFAQGVTTVDVGAGLFGVRQAVELAELVDCVTSVKFAFELLSEGSAIALSIELAGNPMDPGDSENAAVVTYTPGDGYTRAELRAAGVVTAFSPIAHVGTPTAFRIIRWGALIIPGVKIGGGWEDFEPLDMPDYQGEQFRLIRLAVDSSSMTRISFDDVNIP